MDYNPNRNVLVGARYPIEARLLQKLEALVDKYALAIPIKGVMPEIGPAYFRPRLVYILAIASDEKIGKKFCAEAETLGAETVLVNRQTLRGDDTDTLERELLDMRDLLASKTPQELARLGRKPLQPYV